MPNQDPKAGLPSNAPGAGTASSVINFPNGIDEQSIIRYAKTRNSVFEKWFGDYVKKIATIHKMWLNEPTGMSKGMSPVPLPIAHGIVESINARLSSVLFARPKYIDALPQQISEDNSRQKKVEDYVNQELKDISPQPDKGKAAVKAAILDSFIIWRNVWKQCVEKISVPNYQPMPGVMPQMGPNGPIPPPMMYMGDTEQDQSYEHWDWELKNPENCAWDPHCTTRVQESAWFRERTRMSYNQLMKWQQEGRVSDIDRLKVVTPSGLNPGMKKDWESTIREADGDKNWAFTYADEKEFKVEEWFAEVTYEGPVMDTEMDEGSPDGMGIIDEAKSAGEFGQIPVDEAEPAQDDTSLMESPVVENETKVMKAHFIIVEDKFVILFEENKLRPQRIPYGSCPMVIKPRSVMGISPLASVQPLQQQINGFSSKQNDLVDQATNRLILYDDSSGLTGRTAFSRLNGLVPVNNVNGAKEFPSNPTTVEILSKYMEGLKTLMTEATGANEQFQGAEGADTLGEFQGLVAAAGSRFADVADTLNQGFIENLADECFMFTQQYGVDGQMIVRQTAGDTPPISLTRADFIGRYKFSAVSSATENYHKQQIADDTNFVSTMNEINQTGGWGPGEIPGTVKKYNLASHLKNVSLPLRGAKNSADQFIDVPLPPPMPMLPPHAGPPMPPPPQEAMPNG